MQKHTAQYVWHCQSYHEEMTKSESTHSSLRRCAGKANRHFRSDASCASNPETTDNVAIVLFTNTNLSSSSFPGVNY